MGLHNKHGHLVVAILSAICLGVTIFYKPEFSAPKVMIGIAMVSQFYFYFSKR